MKVRIGGRLRRGRAIDLRDEPADPERLLAAIADPDSNGVAAPAPGPVHAFVGRLAPGMSIALRPALAAAARSLGRRSPYDEDIAALDRRIADIHVEPIDLEPARRRAAEAGADVAALRERVARLRGRLEAKREADRPTDETRDRLRGAIATLSEAETEALAAEQALASAERAAREVRDRQDRRLSLVDERDNLARRARTALAERIFPQFRRALDAVPVAGRAGAPPDGFDGEPFAAALAVARLATLRAPVVLVGGPFRDPVAARAALDAQVVLV
ncbi:MAG: hypothetical protein ACOCSF_01665 [Halanaeroarchaeum sp.]